MFVQYSSPDGSVVLKTTNSIGFFGSRFGESVSPGSYQGATVQVHSTGGTVYSGSFPNVKYISSTQCDFGTGTKLLTQVPFEACTLRLRLQSGSLSAVHLPVVKLIAHSGSNVAIGPSNMTVYGFKKGSASWTAMSGSAAPLILANETPPYTSSGSYIHDYYVGLSASPSTYTKNSVSLSYRKKSHLPDHREEAMSFWQRPSSMREDSLRPYLTS